MSYMTAKSVNARRKTSAGHLVPLSAGKAAPLATRANTLQLESRLSTTELPRLLAKLEMHLQLQATNPLNNRVWLTVQVL
jgi:hypothetical protein